MSTPMKPRILTVIQARTGSTRLPNKVLLNLGGRPVLERMLERVCAAKFVGKVVVATTTERDDEQIVALCRTLGISYFRGHPTDCLLRHYEALKAFPADAVMKIPSDCPLIDPRVIDKVLSVFLRNYGQFDYVSNLHPATFPDGNDVEVILGTALDIAVEKARRPIDREHTTPYFWQNPNQFRLSNVVMEGAKDFSQSHRWVLDYKEDYQLVQSIFEELYPIDHLFSLERILDLFAKKPHLMKVNAKWLGDSWQRRDEGSFDPHARA